MAVNVGVRQQFALGRGRPGVAVESRRVADERHDFGAGQPFGDRQPALDRLAAGEDIERLHRTRRGREFILAGLERGAAPGEPGNRLEREPVLDHPLCGEQVGNPGNTGVGRDDDGARLGERPRNLRIAIEPVPRAPQRRDDDGGRDKAPGQETQKPHLRAPAAPSIC